MKPDTDLELLREFTSDEDGPSADARSRARAALLERAQSDTPSTERGSPRLWRFPVRLEHLALALSVLVVVAVVAVFLSARGTRSSGSPASSGVELIYRAEPTPQAAAVTSAAMARTVVVMRSRAAHLGVRRAVFGVSGDEITVQLQGVKNIALAEKEVGSTAQLDFYDWEANALTPSGKTVASSLPTQDPAAMEISQGSRNGPGFPGAGSMSLYHAVKLASKQPPVNSANSSHLGDQYYMFGAPGTSACEVAARFYGVTPQAGQRCYLSGPDDNRADLVSGLPPGVTAAGGETLIVPPGTVVLQAADVSSSHQTPSFSPEAQFYVLKDNVALTGNVITNPQQSTDPAGAPDVTFGFTSKGNSEFQHVTAAIARRGELLSGLGSTLDQHFAVALDNQLITAPQIDFHQYPDGVTGDQGATITAGLTVSSARQLATELRLGALPLNLKLIAEKRMPAARG